jgi:putative PIN family toxin of toxin-antitoxin system
VKIIIDTNLWISFLISKKLDDLENLCLSDDVSVIYCDEIISELVDVSSRDKIRKLGVEEKDIARMLSLIITSCVRVSFENAAVSLVRDPDDIYLLSLADATSANFLLTGDKDLLVLQQHGNTEIISYSEFISKR